MRDPLRESLVANCMDALWPGPRFMWLTLLALMDNAAATSANCVLEGREDLSAAIADSPETPGRHPPSATKPLVWLQGCGVECEVCGVPYSSAHRFHGHPDVQRLEAQCHLPPWSWLALCEAPQSIPSAFAGFTPSPFVTAQFAVVLTAPWAESLTVPKSIPTDSIAVIRRIIERSLIPFCRDTTLKLLPSGLGLAVGLMQVMGGPSKALILATAASNPWNLPFMKFLDRVSTVAPWFKEIFWDTTPDNFVEFSKLFFHHAVETPMKIERSSLNETSMQFMKVIQDLGYVLDGIQFQVKASESELQWYTKFHQELQELRNYIRNATFETLNQCLSLTSESVVSKLHGSIYNELMSPNESQTSEIFIASGGKVKGLSNFFLYTTAIVAPAIMIHVLASRHQNGDPVVESTMEGYYSELRKGPTFATPFSNLVQELLNRAHTDHRYSFEHDLSVLEKEVLEPPPKEYSNYEVAKMLYVDLVEEFPDWDIAVNVHDTGNVAEDHRYFRYFDEGEESEPGVEGVVSLYSKAKKHDFSIVLYVKPKMHHPSMQYQCSTDSLSEGRHMDRIKLIKVAKKKIKEASEESKSNDVEPPPEQCGKENKNAACELVRGQGKIGLHISTRLKPVMVSGPHFHFCHHAELDEEGKRMEIYAYGDC
ncbi:unnamed protein product [Cyprideis torosa]|uniref:Uncharacterized protein n=1 Tax=Cyprideis torosa TaxID=163714 RepID=A0A7R8ZSS6_9CRUS|nr:unnamed protein product [Cyprideis torosa]CAG0896239.1 unnamed protein product [Cyprideis torosa]